MDKTSAAIYLPADLPVEHWVTHPETHEDPTFSTWRLGDVADTVDVFLRGTPEQVEDLADRLLAAVAEFRRQDRSDVGAVA